MDIDFDPDKRALTLQHRSLDMAGAGEIFEGNHQSVQDDREDYGEIRWITTGFMGGRLVVVVWTTREGKRRINSLRKANERERKRYRQGYLG